MKIYFVRHGQTDYNKKKVIQGCGIDAPLNLTGHAQANALKETLKDIKFDKLIASNLLRSQETLLPFAQNFNDISIDDRIREICWGIYEGKETTTILSVAYKNMLNEWALNNLDYAIEGGESCNELMQRLKAFIAELKVMDFNNILVCSHGRTLRALMVLLKNEHPKDMEKYNISNCGIIEVSLIDGIFKINNIK